LITGAGFGLGSAFARALARHGAALVCVDIDAARAQTIAAEVTASGARALAIVADVADELAVDTAVRAATAAFGTIDILINNAGITTKPARTHELSIADWDRLMAINLRGTFLVTRAVLPVMLAAKRGSIINLSSMYGLGGFYPGFAAGVVSYAASKAAVIGLTRQCAVEYAQDGIRVNAIAPGFHGGTNLGHEGRSGASPEWIAGVEAAIHAKIPMGRRGTPAELEGLAIFLASDASSYVTGQVFANDGGWTAA
jgi:NAD(P)-dependent dehydrogenase (short-subunit alcohol dehydrogenase family)